MSQDKEMDQITETITDITSDTIRHIWEGMDICPITADSYIEVFLPLKFHVPGYSNDILLIILVYNGIKFYVISKL
jgi:hypothetical protein